MSARIVRSALASAGTKRAGAPNIFKHSGQLALGGINKAATRSFVSARVPVAGFRKPPCFSSTSFSSPSPLSWPSLFQQQHHPTKPCNSLTRSLRTSSSAFQTRRFPGHPGSLSKGNVSGKAPLPFSRPLAPVAWLGVNSRRQMARGMAGTTTTSTTATTTVAPQQPLPSSVNMIQHGLWSSEHEVPLAVRKKMVTITLSTVTSATINAAIATLMSGSGGNIVMEAGTWTLDAPIDLDFTGLTTASNSPMVNIYGEGNNATYLVWDPASPNTSGDNPCFIVTGTSGSPVRCLFSDFQLSGPCGSEEPPVSSIGVKAINAMGMLMNRVTVTGCDYGFVGQGVTELGVTNCNFDSNCTGGMRLEPSTAWPPVYCNKIFMGNTRLCSNGKYGAMLSFVSNFNWIGGVLSGNGTGYTESEDKEEYFGLKALGSGVEAGRGVTVSRVASSENWGLGDYVLADYDNGDDAVTWTVAHVIDNCNFSRGPPPSGVPTPFANIVLKWSRQAWPIILHMTHNSFRNLSGYSDTYPYVGFGDIGSRSQGNFWDIRGVGTNMQQLWGARLSNSFMGGDGMPIAECRFDIDASNNIILKSARNFYTPTRISKGMYVLTYSRGIPRLDTTGDSDRILITMISGPAAAVNYEVELMNQYNILVQIRNGAGYYDPEGMSVMVWSTLVF